MKDMVETENKRCNMSFCPDPEKGWILRIDSVGDECGEALTKATSKLGPHARRFLARRIETNNPEVEKFLDSIGLMPQTEKSS